VLDWCHHHQNDPIPHPEGEWVGGFGDQLRHKQIIIGDWDREYIKCEQEMLFELIQAASYLDIKPLL
jgi:S-phase kinase-associated protein 1